MPKDPGPNAPLAFLSYAREDGKTVDELAKKLLARGVRVWQDTQKLRAGQRWLIACESVIRKKVNYVVVINSQTMATRESGVFNLEIDFARQRQREMNEKLRFLMPVRIDNCPLLSSLEEFHAIDVSKPSGVDDLVKSIQEDWATRNGLPGGPS